LLCNQSHGCNDIDTVRMHMTTEEMLVQNWSGHTRRFNIAMAFFFAAYIDKPAFCTHPQSKH
ncbi:MAG: hypothetical protein ACKPKO_09340, partial [Candidatus Fonsibacter sp.]